MAENYDYSGYIGELNIKIRDMDEKQRILKDRVLLIGENLIELKDKTTDEIIELKKNVQELKQTIERFHTFLESVSAELSKFARKDDLEILAKQAKMFQPLEFIRKTDLEKLKKM